jgi:outer membrane protein assembly factor BamB
VVGNVVYYSSLGNHNSSGLDVRSGKKVWGFPHGAFNPVISDGKRVYLTTNSTLFGLIPKQAQKPGQKPRTKKKRH